MKKPKTIPTLLGLFLLIIATAAGIFLTQSPTSLGSKAGTDCQPKNVQISNLTDTSVNISFLTDASCLSSLSLDDRNFSQSEAQNSHYFFTHQLKPQTEYRFILTSGGQDYAQDDYRFTTGTTPSGSTPTSNLAWGMVKNPDQTPAQGALVFLSIDGASLLSAKTTSQGLYHISLATSFNYPLTSWFTPPANTQQDFVVISSNGIITQVVGNTNQSNPVPDIIIGQDQLEDQSPNSPAGQVDQLPINTLDTDLTLSNPKEGETIPNQQPQFFGSAPKGEPIEIIVESEPVYTDQVIANQDGSWSWTPPADLEPGDHTITVSSGGQTIVRHFTVLAAEGAPAFTASSSAGLATATPTPTKTPTPSPKPASTSIPTATSTLAIRATPTVIPTIRTQKPATDSAVPVTGNSLPSVTLLSLSVFFILGYILVREKNHSH